MISIKRTGHLLVVSVAVGLALFATLFSSTPIYAQTAVPYTIGNDGHYLIEVKVNEEKSFPFIIDTAAQNSSITRLVVNELGIKSNGMTTYVHGANGAAKADMFVLKTIHVGDVNMKKLMVSSLPNSVDNKNIGGIIGMDFLNKFAIEFNPNIKTIKIHKKRKLIKKVKQNSRSIALKRHWSGFLMTEININKQVVPVIIDTGARRNVINWRAANKIGVDKLHASLIDDDPIIGASGTKFELTKKTFLPNVNIGDQVWVDHPVTIANIRVFDLLGFSEKPAGIFGMKLFRDKHYVLDFRSNELTFIG